MLVVDTNVLVYAANADAPEHARCRDLLERLRRSDSPWYLTWSIGYEFLRVVTHPRVMARPWDGDSAMTFLRLLLGAPAAGMLRETDRHRSVLHTVIAELPFLSGNLFHDAHTAALMREHGIRTIVTRDLDFHRFPFLDVRDPLTGD